ncbi:MAG TPA: hypothetical protein VLT33_35870 [Labilithrix sp.]|nr:hypothetical protein [Labilithrix sp.]
MLTSQLEREGPPISRARLTLTERFRSQHAIVTLASRWSGYVIAVLTPFVGHSVRIERELVARGLLERGGVLDPTAAAREPALAPLAGLLAHR